MGMQIATNVTALNAQRNLNMTGIKMGKVLEKLSSGFRINRAADDAAGLGISEKMRAQIRGSQQAVRNSQDGISMLQTAEGALDEVHSILQRMRELSVQAANGTYGEDGAERTAIGQEIEQLKDEINRIASSTEFNGQKLLTGSLSGTLGTGGLQIGDPLGADAEISDIAVSGATPNSYEITSDTAGEVTMESGGISQTLTVETGLDQDEETTLNFDQFGVSITVKATTGTYDANAVATALATENVEVEGSGPSQLQVGANVGDNLQLSFGNMQTTELGSDGSTLADLVTDDQNVSTIAKAEGLITEIDVAIEQVNAQRGEFGAAQNRLESTVRSLSVAVENLSAAESRIRDADIAKLSSELVSNQILQQAGVSVLSQANSTPQAAVQLLQG